MKGRRTNPLLGVVLTLVFSVMSTVWVCLEVDAGLLAGTSLQVLS